MRNTVPERLFEVSEALTSAHRELADLLAAEHECKVQTFMASEETSVQARDRIASWQALNLTVDILKLRGEINALTEERDILKLQIEWGLTRAGRS